MKWRLAVNPLYFIFLSRLLLFRHKKCVKWLHLCVMCVNIVFFCFTFSLATIFYNFMVYLGKKLLFETYRATSIEAPIHDNQSIRFSYEIIFICWLSLLSWFLLAYSVCCCEIQSIAKQWILNGDGKEIDFEPFSRCKQLKKNKLNYFPFYWWNIKRRKYETKMLISRKKFAIHVLIERSKTITRFCFV